RPASIAPKREVVCYGHRADETAIEAILGNVSDSARMAEAHPGNGIDDAGGHLRQGGLAVAADAGDADDLIAVHGQVHRVETFDATAVHADRLQLEHGFAGIA